MKSMNLCSYKTSQFCLALLRHGKKSDEVHEEICSKLGLYGVKYFGHGTAYQKRKVEHIWRSILFILYDFTEFSNMTTVEQKQEISNYLELKVDNKNNFGLSKSYKSINKLHFDN